MTEVTYQPIDRFIARVRRASVTGGKSINLSIEEATELTAAMAQILLQRVVEESRTPVDEVIEVQVHGGGFK